MRLGVYIGSFNPVHLGHIKVINYLLEKNYIDHILVVPTLSYWNKVDLADIKDRINMLKFFQSAKVMIDEVHNYLIYTYELLQELEKVYDDELYLIIGADNIIDFDKWKDYEKLLNYHIIIMNRDDINIDKYIKKYPINKFIIVKDYPYINVSSSDIRKNLDSKYLDKRVLDYIKINNLYRGNNEKNN